MTEQVKDAITIVKQITAPKEEWVLERLGAIKEIAGTQAVTPHQNPDGLLDKEEDILHVYTSLHQQPVQVRCRERTL